MAIASNEVTSGTWITPSPTLSRFGSINRTVISILPLVVVIGFMASAGLSGLTGSGQIGGIIRGEVGALIFVLIAISLGPVIFDTLGDASEVVDGDTLSVTKEFGSIQTLILGFVPVIFTLGIIALVGYRAHGAYRSMRGGSGMM